VAPPAIVLLLVACAARHATPEPELVGPGEVLSVTLAPAPEAAPGPPTPEAPAPAEMPAAEVAPGDVPGDALPACAAEPAVPMRAVDVAGALVRDVVVGAVLADLSPVRACVQDALPSGLPGQVVLRLSVTPDGRVSRSVVASDTTGSDGRLAGCLARALAGTTFPAADGPTWVCWPVNVHVRSP
jgi:hypothetical protein